MDEERPSIGEQIDAFDRAVRRARLRRTIVEAAVVAGVAVLVGGLIGLAVAGVEGMFEGAAGGLLVVILPAGIVVTYQIYTYQEDEWW